MEDTEDKNQSLSRLFQLLLWGNCIDPPTFLTLLDFQAWATGMGYDPESCEEPFAMFAEFFPERLLL
ncbi:MAG: hypothetical protein PHE17_18065 [Thiothrix sp.]|uniref:hypothetical protein n=1 Tax=Thiothrix sp. TaxID=1032 RepID=UPI00260CBEF1|nr:hypothetical protein [Thiothrix sp.]MDD5394927.1 hypothetical protein [Thiothrix sp.]